MSDDRAASRSLMETLQALHQLQALDDLLPDPGEPLGRETVDFFENNWKNARDGLLSKTTKIRVWPKVPAPDPRVFAFEMDIPFKRKSAADATVELVDGPIRGVIRYRSDILTADREEPAIGVFIDPTQHLYNGHYSRRFGVLCVGDEPPRDLEDLLIHIHGILTMANRNSSDPADAEAARYFASDPDAMKGLELVEPLY